jgi:hypothetical protein
MASPTQIGFLDIMLPGMALALSTSLLECQSPLFNDFETFFEKLNAMFRNLDKERTSTTEL